MKKVLLLALIASASLYAESEVELYPSHIKGSGSYEGSVTEHEAKNIILVTKEDIAKKNYPDLVAIFQDSPVTMVTHTPAGTLIALRGSGEKTIMRVKVLLDGNNITSIDEAMGVIPFNAIPVSSIEKIEIIPGGGITLYGSGSSSGVINIVTKQGVTKDYGQVNLGVSSFHNREVSLNKGISLGDKLFVNVALEGKKGDGYRDKDKAAKFNLMSSVNYQINDKNKFKVSYAKFHENRDTTDEISLWELKRNRRAAGESLSNTISDRDAYALDYQFTPSKNWDMQASWNHSRYTRDISQDATPHLTLMPGGFFAHEIFEMDDMEDRDIRIDPVMVDTRTVFKGKFDEKIDAMKFKTNYKHDRGNLVFGVEHEDHSLLREFRAETGPFAREDTNLLVRKKGDKLFTKDRLTHTKDGAIVNAYQAFSFGDGRDLELGDIEVLDKDGYRMQTTQYFNRLINEENLYNMVKKLSLQVDFGENFFRDYDAALKPLRDLYARGDKDEIARYKDEHPDEFIGGDYLDMATQKLMAEGNMTAMWAVFSLLNDVKTNENALNMMEYLEDDRLYSDLEKREITFRIASSDPKDIVYYVHGPTKYNKQQSKELDVSGMTQEEIDQLYKDRNDMRKYAASLGKDVRKLTREERQKFQEQQIYRGPKYYYHTIQLHEGMLFPEAEKLVFADYNPSYHMATVLNAKVDVKKKTSSAYLYNDFDLTDKWSINAGLRYEQAKYSGNRFSEVGTVLYKTGDLDKEFDPKIVSRLRYELPTYYKMSKAYKMDIVKNEHDNEGNAAEYFSDQIINELSTKHSAYMPMAYIASDVHKRESNLGGELGFNYKLNDDNTVYTKFERAFNTPVPTQLTNKTFDPVNRVKVYWDSNLKTEIIHNFEIGFRGALNEHISYSLAGFMSDTKDEIVTLIKDGNSHMNREWRFINLEKTRRLGVEFQSEQFFDKLHLKESFTYVDPKIVSNDYATQLRDITKRQMDELITYHRDYDKSYLEKRNEIIKAKAEKDGLDPNYINVDKGMEIIAEVYKDPKYQEQIKNFVENTRNSREVLKVKYGKNQYFEDYKDEFLANNAIYQALSDKEKEALEGPIKQMMESDAVYSTSVGYWIDKEAYQATMKSGNYFKKGDRIPLAPKFKATFGADYQFTDKLKLGTNLTYVGDYYTAEPSYGYEIVKTKVDGHFLTDIYGTYHFTPDTSLKIGVNNVFNHEYNQRQDSDTAVPAPGRTYSLGFTHKF